jgi:hypothetical protein
VRGYWLNEKPKSPRNHILHVYEKLFVHGLVGAKQFRVLLINGLDPGGVAHALGHAGTMAATGSPGIRRGRMKFRMNAKTSVTKNHPSFVAEVIAISFQPYLLSQAPPQ